MCRKVSLLLPLVSALAFTAARDAHAATDWRRIGNAAIELGLASVATGPAERVWYAEDGSRLYALTEGGRVLETDDFEQWRPSAAVPPAADDNGIAVALPEQAAKLRSVAGASRLYGFGVAAYRSEDGGASWSNLTQYQGRSLLGGPILDLAVSPHNPDEVALATVAGIWRSVDGGLSWSGMNQSLPNLPVRHILGLPSGARGVRIGVTGADQAELEWVPGERAAWHLSENADRLREESTKAALSKTLGTTITAVAGFASTLYAGGSDGRLWASQDRGATWGTPSDPLPGRIEAIFVSSRDPRIALAGVGSRTPGSNPAIRLPHVLRTMNGGIFWDDMTANLPDTPAFGVAADAASGAVYVASGAGVFLTQTDLGSAGRATSWVSIGDQLPRAPVKDVKLDPGGNQVFVALEGYGVYTTLAPHRMNDVRVVSSADLTARAASPGALLSVVGTEVQSARSADSGQTIPVLSSSAIASQIQIPFTAKGAAVSLALDASAGKLRIGLPLFSAAPAIFVDPDGTPLILDGDSGVLLDASKPARAGSRVQILAAGLGQVNPDWPAGMAAPLTDPPHVQASVHAYLDRVPLRVTQAVLAPGYIGFYLVEVELPGVVNSGPGDIYLEADGQSSNHVRLHVAQ